MSGNPILTLLELNGDLQGQDRNGIFTATGSGALRWQPAEGGRANLCRNPRAASNTNGWGYYPGSGGVNPGSLASDTTVNPFGLGSALKVTLTDADYGEAPALAYVGHWNASAGHQIRVTPGTSYQCRVWAWTDAPTQVFLEIRLLTQKLDGSATSTIAGPSIHVAETITASSEAAPQLCKTFPFVQPSGKEILYPQINLGATSGNANVACNIWMIVAFEEAATSEDSYFDGSSPNAVWLDPITGQLGTPHASPSVSEATAWVEEGTSNLVPNPWRAVDNTGWSALNGTTGRTTAYAYQGPAAGLVTASAANAEERISITAAAASHTAQAIVRNMAAASRQCQLTYNDSLVGSPVSVAAGASVGITAAFTGTGGAANLGVRWIDSANTETFVTYYLGGEQRTYATSPCPAIDVSGTLLTGYSWASTAHASASTRSASSASISPAGILAPDTGSLAFRFRRLIDTGGTETLLECGTAGSGTDYLSISVNSSDKLVVSWNSDNAGAQTVTSTESIAVDTEYFVYTEWASGTMGLSIDNGDLVVGARDAVEGDWGVGELVLEAT